MNTNFRKALLLIILLQSYLTNSCQSNVSHDEITTNTANASASVKIIPYDILDFDRHAQDRMGTGFHPKNWFTGFATHHPRENNMDHMDTAGWSTEALPFRPAHYPKGISDQNGMTNYRGDRGWRLLFDMNGDKDMFKLSKYKITDIYGLQQGGDFLDTLYFYNFDKVFDLPAEQRAIFLARCDSLLTPFAKLVQGHTTTWRPEWCNVSGINDSMRYILVVMRRRERGKYSSFPHFSELVIYGEQLHHTGTIKLKPFTYSGSLPKRKPLREFLGVNNVGIKLSQLQYDAAVRGYIAVGNYDDDTTAYPNNIINPNPWNWSQSYWQQELGGAKAEGRMWFESIRAGSKRLEKYKWGVVAKSLPVTEGGMEPEDWHSYDRMGNFFYHYAALFGNNPNHNDSSFRWRNKSELPGYGLGYYKAVEPGNEDESRGSTLLAMVVKDNVVKDGYEGRVPHAGIRLGDSTMKLVMPATIYLDTSMYKSMIFLCRFIRNDRKVIWDYFNGHHYSRKYRDPTVTEHDPTYEEMWGTQGATPEWDDIYMKISQTEKVIFRELDGDTSKRFIMTEWGYDNYSKPSTSVAEQVYNNRYGAFWTISTTPRVKGRDSLEGKGMLMVRGESLFAATRMAFYNEYMITNVSFDPNNDFPGLFARSGRGAAGPGGSNTDLPTKFPHYWSRASFWNIAKDYVVDSVYAIDSLGKCLIKWRHLTRPDSVMYELWKGTWNGSTLKGVIIPVGTTIGSNATRRTLSFTSPAPGESTIPIINKQIVQTATEEPVFIFVREPMKSVTTGSSKR